jgi:glycosyltransferase involved in cell wall biosynthesis
MTIDLIFPRLPPALDGIGDHTARLAGALATQGSSVRVLTAQEDADPVPGVTVERGAFGIAPPYEVRGLRAAVRRDPPDVLVLQYNPFSYGRWGFNPWLPEVMRTLQREHPRLRLVVMMHEPFVPVTDWKFALMTIWQRWQFWRLGRTADLLLCSIDAWVTRFRPWFPDTPVRHLPVGSNMPDAGISREEARRRLGIDDGAFVAGVFGSVHGSRLLEYVRRAAGALQQRTDGFVLLYVGPGGETMRAAMGASLPLIDAGALPGKDVSVHLSAMDVYLAPFRHGVSTRRGSFMAGLQHGLPTVSTRGPHTDRLLIEEDGRACMLAPDDDADAFRRCVLKVTDDARRTRLGEAAQNLFDAHFTWERIAEKFMASLKQDVSRAHDECGVPEARHA